MSIVVVSELGLFRMLYMVFKLLIDDFLAAWSDFQQAHFDKQSH